MITFPTHKYRIWHQGVKVLETDNLLVALEHFGEFCGSAPKPFELSYNPDKHEVTGEPLLEARFGRNKSDRLWAVLYGVTLDQWVEHGKAEQHEAARG